MKFKVGDKVRCVDDSPNQNNVGAINIKKSNVYEVREVNGSALLLKGNDDYWSTSRFEFAEPKKYTVPKPFSIIDIFRKLPTNSLFLELLVELEDDPISDCWTGMGSILESKVLKRNLPWLEEKGFIVEKKEEWPWVNVYSAEGGAYCSYEYKTKQKAIKASENTDGFHLYIATIKLKPKESQ